jgi:hypothetical protein
LPPPDYYDINGLCRCSLIQNDLEVASANVTMPSDQIIDLAARSDSLVTLEISPAVVLATAPAVAKV